MSDNIENVLPCINKVIIIISIIKCTCYGILKRGTLIG